MRGATLAVAVPMIFLVGAIGVVLAGTRDRRLAWPIVAVGYPLVVVLSWVVLDEPVSAPRLIGSVIIFVGVAIVARG